MVGDSFFDCCLDFTDFGVGCVVLLQVVQMGIVVVKFVEQGLPVRLALFFEDGFSFEYISGNVFVSAVCAELVEPGLFGECFHAFLDFLSLGGVEGEPGVFLVGIGPVLVFEEGVGGVF